MVTLVCFFTDNKKYDKLLEVSINSFKAFHKSDNYILTALNDDFIKNDNIHKNKFDRLSPGIKKYLYSYLLYQSLRDKNNVNKLIILGADTITCSRLDEFLDNDTDDVIATLDYEYKIPLEIKNSNKDNHINADVVCFNNIKALEDCINLYFSGFISNYYEQGCLNKVLISGDYSYSYKIVDHTDFNKSNVFYNCRSKGTTASSGKKPWKKYVKKFYVKNGGLYTRNNIRIKLFHYAEGLGTLNDEDFKSLMNKWIFEFFNKDTKKFFKQFCNSGNFFEKKYEI